MFYKCKKLLDIITLENWNVSKGDQFDAMFGELDRDIVIKTIQKWNISKEQYNSIKNSSF